MARTPSPSDDTGGNPAYFVQVHCGQHCEAWTDWITVAVGDDRSRTIHEGAPAYRHYRCPCGDHPPWMIRLCSAEELGEIGARHAASSYVRHARYVCNQEVRSRLAG
jgi:hypothetical protein